LKQKWHPDCFTCCSCKEIVKESTFAVREGKPLCGNCVSKEFGSAAKGGAGGISSLVCEVCNKPIGLKYIKIEDKPLHPECFVCQNCKKNLTDGYAQVGSKKLCGECANAEARANRLGQSSGLASGSQAVSEKAKQANISAARRDADPSYEKPAEKPAYVAPVVEKPAYVAPVVADKPFASSSSAGGVKPLPSSSVGKLTCGRCMEEMDADAAFCPACRAKVPRKEERRNSLNAGARQTGGLAPAQSSGGSQPAASGPAKASKFCGECGAGIPSGSKCPQCGALN